MGDLAAAELYHSFHAIDFLREANGVVLFEFVIMVLCKVFGFAAEKAYQHAMHAHTKGEVIVWTGSKEVAELKLEQMLTFHEDRDDGRKFGPLSCRIEPAA